MTSTQKEVTLNIEYYAMLREERGCQSETIKTDAITVADLFQKLKKKHSFSLNQKTLRVAINNEFREWSSRLSENDTVVFIPPVAGG